MSRLHGAFRDAQDRDRDQGQSLSMVCVGGMALRPGSPVRLQPNGRADAFDILLRGKMATIVSIEQDYENTIYVTVTVDDDPGRDFGRQGQIGHRFFFRLHEVEPIGAGELPS